MSAYPWSTLVDKPSVYLWVEHSECDKNVFAPYVPQVAVTSTTIFIIVHRAKHSAMLSKPQQVRKVLYIEASGYPIDHVTIDVKWFVRPPSLQRNGAKLEPTSRHLRALYPTFPARFVSYNLQSVLNSLILENCDGKRSVATRGGAGSTGLGAQEAFWSALKIVPSHVEQKGLPEAYNRWGMARRRICLPGDEGGGEGVKSAEAETLLSTILAGLRGNKGAGEGDEGAGEGADKDAGMQQSSLHMS
ncbi:hypothetical protein C8R45DRAFT_924286 [Mycena sanguinolenta]|nr:hypothetical protein C8R45DRAFT_924286 [Mycena sanguinolenta]